MLLILTPIAIAGWCERDELDVRARRLYWGYRCAHHVTPPATVLREDDPKRAAVLLAANEDYVAAISSPNPRPWDVCAIYVPHEWREYAQVEPRSVLFSPTMRGANHPIEFAGERTSPDGTRWLVVIAGASSNAHDLDERLYSLVLPFPTPLERLPASSWHLINGYVEHFVHTTFAPGAADPQDRSHLYFDFDLFSVLMTGQRPMIGHGRMDVYVQNAGMLRWQLDEATTPQ